MREPALTNCRPINNKVFVGIYDDGTSPINLGGKTFYTMSDIKVDNNIDNSAINDKVHRGIRARWGIVLSVSKEDSIKNSGLDNGDIVYMEKMEWSRSMVVKDDSMGSVKVWTIPVDKIMVKRDLDTLTQEEKDQIFMMYPSSPYGIK